MSEKFKAVIIGGGPGGYVCAIRLAQLGIKTACIESRGTLGGTCLNIGCIPSKSLLNLSENFYKAKHFSNLGIEVGKIKLNLKKMMKNKDEAVTTLTKGIEFLFKKNKVTYYKGTGSFKSHNQISIVGDKNKEIVIETDKTIISTGSEPVSLPGIKFDEKVIISSTGALSLSAVPKKMVVVGGGYIGLEMGSVWSRLGAKVRVIEFLDQQNIIATFVIGHSMGGKVAMQVALNTPEKVDKLVVLDIAPVTYEPRHDDVFKGLNAVNDARISSRQDADSVMSKYIVEPSVRQFLLKSLVKTQNRFDWKFNLTILQNKYCDILQAPSGTAFTGKTLFIKGSNSEYITENMRDVFLKFFPKCKAKVIHGTGHWLHAEKPTAVNKSITDFILD